MIQFWKVMREAKRLKEVVSAWTANLYEPWLTNRHDQWRRHQAEPSNQGVSQTEKIAIFLIYQPHGVAASVLVTLRWLIANGYAPLLVANTSLSVADQKRLAPVTWRIFQRPNFGYDFGGYRDGILLLDAWGIVPKRVLILNDSVWMPTNTNSTLIQRLEANGANIVGGIRHSDSIRRSGAVRRGHLESYLYLINEEAWLTSAFRSFWQSYPASNKRLNAVYRGERSFTYVMQDANLAVEGLFTKQIFFDQLDRQDDQFLWRTLKYASYVEPELREECSFLLAQDPASSGWRDMALLHIRRTCERRRFNACFVLPALNLLGMDFIKKSTGSTGDGGASLHSRMRHQLLQASAECDLPHLVPEMLQEIALLENRELKKFE